MAADPIQAGKDRHQEIGRRQSLFRELNERIEELAGSFDLLEALPLVCECGSPRCDNRLELSIAEYEKLRSDPTHFAVLPGHEIADVERVVEENERFFVVEKVGASAAEATELDPRRKD
jgi:hypothetical protein